MKRIMTALLLMLPSMSAAPADEPVTANLILQQAVAAAQSIEDPYGRANGLMRIAERQSVAGERAAATATLEKALNAAQLITDDDRRAIRLQAVAEAQARAGDLAGAAATAGLLADRPPPMPEYRQLLVSTLTSIAVAQAAAGDRAAAAATFQRATGVAESSRFAPVAAMLATIVIAQAEAGDRSAGMAMLERAVAAANSLVPSRPERASSAFATIAKAQAALGERAAAAAALDQALQAAASIQSAMSRSLSLGDVAKAQIRIGDSAAARATLQEALDASRLEEAPDMHRMALMMIAETQAEAGDAAGAARSLQEARAIAESSHSDSMLQEIAAVQAGIGPGSLLEAFPNALAVALKSRGGGVGAGAAPAAPGGDLDAALATAMLIEDPWKRYNALMAISSPWLAAGDYIALQEPMREALVAAQDMGDSGPAFVVLHNLAMVAVAGGNIDGPLGVAKKLATSGTPPYLAASIAWVQAERGDSAGAAASLQVVLEGSASLRIDLRSQLAYLIALAQANMGDLTTALATVDGIADPAMRTRALIAIAADDPPPELQSFMMANLVGQ